MSSDSDFRPSPAPARSRILFALGAVLLVGAAIPAAIGPFARWIVLAEISTHFRVLYALSAIAAGFCFALGRRSLACTAACAVLVWWAAGIVPWYLPPSPIEARGPSLKLFTSNVNANTSNYPALLSAIRNERPDFVFIQELSPEWAHALEALNRDYPYRIVTARRDFFGLGLYSRYPLENIERGDPVNSDVPIERADAAIGTRRVHLINMHIAPPEGGWLTVLRYNQLRWLTDYLATRTGPVIAAGDFNCTMWSPLYLDLVQRKHLLNARKGHGILPSWFPLAGMLHLIPIDQILAGGGIGFTGAHLGARMGSDHCPFVAELRLPE